MEQDLIAMFEDVMELDEGSLTPDTRFRDFAEWNSVAHLSVIAAVDDQYDVTLPLEEFRALHTIKELTSYIQSRKSQ